jgi:methyl-accepting chemotaxis protein
VEQINKAVIEMDKVVQKNAASAEESASAAREMNDQAERMEGFVGKLVEVVSGGNGIGTGTFTGTDSARVLSRTVGQGKHIMAVDHRAKGRPGMGFPGLEKKVKARDRSSSHGG